MSSRLISLCTDVSCLRDFSSLGTSLNFSGRIGRSAKRHFLSFGSYSSGGASPTRCPTAHVITYSSPSRYVLSFDGVYVPGSADERSRPTEGFSAMTRVLLMAVSRRYAPMSTDGRGKGEEGRASPSSLFPPPSSLVQCAQAPVPTGAEARAN